MTTNAHMMLWIVFFKSDRNPTPYLNSFNLARGTVFQNIDLISAHHEIIYPIIYPCIFRLYLNDMIVSSDDTKKH